MEESGLSGELNEEQRTLYGEILDAFGMKKRDIRTYSPLALAFVGDGVYSFVIRTLEAAGGNRGADDMHRDTSTVVRAPAQAAAADALAELLTAEEAAVYRRGRNANPPHHARNSSLEDYLKATGLEALCGYLFLAGQEERLLFLVREGLIRTGMLREREDGTFTLVPERRNRNGKQQ